MIEYEPLPFRKYKENRYVSMVQFQEYIEKYLQYQYFKTIEDVRRVLMKCADDQILSSDDIYYIFYVICNTPAKADFESSERYPNTSLPFYRIDKNHKNIQDLYDKYIDSDDNTKNNIKSYKTNGSDFNLMRYDEMADDVNKRYNARKEGNSEMVNHNVYGSFMKEDKKSEYDVVRKPEHYNYSKIQPKDVIRAWGLNFNLGSAVKYIARAGHKDDIIQDLSKAIQFIQFDLEYYNDHVLNGQCESTVMDYVADKILEYYEYANDEDNEYNISLLRTEWDLASEKQSLGFAIDYIHMFHYIGGCGILLKKAINNIQDYIDIIEKERNDNDDAADM